MRMFRNIFGRLRDAAPILSVGLLLLLPMALPDSSSVNAATRAHHERVAKAIEGIPYRIGDWRGEEVAVPGQSQVQAVLNQNALLSRRYQNLAPDASLTSPLHATLVVVHCSDTRDMLGHWPPNCFRAAGWSPGSERLAKIHADVGLADEFDVFRYDFYKVIDFGVERRIRVYNFFILPNGQIAPGFDQLSDLAGRTATSSMGVAQVQIVFHQELTAEQELAAIEDLLGGISEVFLHLGRQKV